MYCTYFISVSSDAALYHNPQLSQAHAVSIVWKKKVYYLHQLLHDEWKESFALEKLSVNVSRFSALPRTVRWCSDLPHTT